MIKCRKCGQEMFAEEIAELHHIIPRCIGGSDKDGRKYLCKKCHNIIHKILLKWVWKFVCDSNKENCKKYIQRLTKWWIEKG